MSNNPPALAELTRLKEELALQTHLMTMDAKDKWHILETKVACLEGKLENTLSDLAEKLGKTEENLFVGDEKEIEQLVKEFQDLRRSM